MNIKGKILKTVNNNLARKNMQKFFEKLYLTALSGMNIGSATYEFDKNGELFLIKKLREFYGDDHIIVVFDVGAHNGSYAKLIDSSLVNKEIYCFEPFQVLYETLERDLAKNSSVHLHKLALSNENSTDKLYSGENLIPTMMADYFEMSREIIQSSEDVQTKTLDSFCEENHIENIDLLKIDVEGYEFKVLEGSKNLINKGIINFIQFEFGQHCIASRSFFYDFFNLLSPSYEIYRILTDGFYKLEQYDYKYEVFVSATNYLAVNKLLGNKFSSL